MRIKSLICLIAYIFLNKKKRNVDENIMLNLMIMKVALKML